MIARHRYGLAALALATVIPIATLAQPSPSSSYTTFAATPAKPVELGYYASAHKSTCSPAPLPEVGVAQAPKLGVLTVRSGELTTNKIAGCPALRTPVQVVFYEARVGTTGSDHLVYKVTTSDREVKTYDVTINIKRAPAPLAVPLEKQQL